MSEEGDLMLFALMGPAKIIKQLYYCQSSPLIFNMKQADFISSRIKILNIIGC
jgi:hypothetical protein